MRRILAPLSVLLPLQLLLGVVTSTPTFGTTPHNSIAQQDDSSEVIPSENRALHESFEINHADGSIVMPPTSSSMAVNPSQAITSTLPATTSTEQTAPDGPSKTPVKQENGVCPPCPQCVAGGDFDPIYNSNDTVIQEPLTMQILVVDSPGIITMGKLMLSALL